MSKDYSHIFDKAFDYREALKSTNIAHEDVLKLKEKVKDNKDIPRDFPEKLYLVFLVLYKNDIEKAARRLNTFFKLKRSCPEFFRNRNVNDDSVRKCMKNQFYLMLPRLSETTTLAYHALNSHVPSDYNLGDAIKMMIMTSETMIYNNGPSAFQQVYLFDMTGASLSHIFRSSISVVRKGLTFLETASPCRIAEIHVLNSSSFMNLVLALVRPFIKSGILERTHFYSSSIDWEKFYKDCIPKSHLPSNYGGDLESIEVLHEKTCQKIKDIAEYFELEEEMIFGEK